MSKIDALRPQLFIYRGKDMYILRKRIRNYYDMAIECKKTAELLAEYAKDINECSENNIELNKTMLQDCVKEGFSVLFPDINKNMLESVVEVMTKQELKEFYQAMRNKTKNSDKLELNKTILQICVKEGLSALFPNSNKNMIGSIVKVMTKEELKEFYQAMFKEA